MIASFCLICASRYSRLLEEVSDRKCESGKRGTDDDEEDEEEYVEEAEERLEDKEQRRCGISRGRRMGDCDVAMLNSVHSKFVLKTLE
jgi:hypothetical protein